LSHIACPVGSARRGTIVPERQGLQAIEQAFDRDEVRKRPGAVDLDHGKVLAVLRFERLDAADVDELEGELLLTLGLSDNVDRTVTEVATLCVIQRYGVHPSDEYYG
jgi:hypothetical protein